MFKVDITLVFRAMFLSLMLMLSQVGFAKEVVSVTKADIKVELIQELKKDGYLSDKMATEVSGKYITEEDKKPIAEVIIKESKSITWEKWLSWTNFFKVLGIILCLIAFSGFLKKIILGLWDLIVAVPQYVYQTGFLGLFGTGVLRPDLIWESQSFYVALFSSFALLMVLAWVIEAYPKVLEFVKKLFNLGIPFESILSFYGMLYFGALAWFYQSSIFGFFAAVCLSGVFSFTMKYMPGVLFLDFKEKMLNAVVFGHLAVLAIYVYFFMTMPEITKYYDVGIQYYCTIAMSVGLLVGASPFYKRGTAMGYALMFVVLFFLANYGYFFMDLKVIGSIVSCFFVLLVLEWLGYIGFKGGLIVGCATLGASLYALSLLLEKYGSMIILSLS